MQRVEVLRGPQGTLYGRNATAGVVNLIPALPDDMFGLDTKVEVGNYKTMRASGMINVPITDTLAIRAAGALTSRDGFDYNTFTQRRVNGRQLWSTRLSMQWKPSDRLKINAIWQHFDEDDDRSRTGKQLCTRDPGPAEINGIRIPDGTQPGVVTPGVAGPLLRVVVATESNALDVVPNAGRAGVRLVGHGTPLSAVWMITRRKPAAWKTLAHLRE